MREGFDKAPPPSHQWPSGNLVVGETLMWTMSASLMPLLALWVGTALAEEVCGALPPEERSGAIEGDLVVQGGQCDLSDAVIGGDAIVRSGDTLRRCPPCSSATWWSRGPR